MTEILGSIEHTVEAEYSSFLKREPVVLAHLISGPLAGVASLLVTHGVITSTQATSATQQAVAYAITVAIALQGFLIRRFVKPAWKSTSALAAPVIMHGVGLSDVSEVSDLMDEEPELDGAYTPDGVSYSLLPDAAHTPEQIARLSGQTP